MKRALFLFSLLATSLAGCSYFGGTGPLPHQVLAQAARKGDILFDVVNVDDRVVAALLDQPKEGFAVRFKKYVPPPELKIAVGDRIAVIIWEAGPGGLFTAVAPRLIAPGEENEIVPLPGQSVAPAGEVSKLQRQLEAEAAGIHGTVIPPQTVLRDGAITIPYAGRIPVVGRTAPEVEQAVKARLLGKALMPEILVLVAPGPANSVAVSGEGIRGRRVPLAPAGERLLQVIAAAGGAQLPVRDLVVRLSRGGVTATIPYQKLVENPDEDIYAEPGDALTIARVPKTFSVFGATQLNYAFKINTPRFSLDEALAKAAGLNDATAAPHGVFLFRYERDSIVRALGEPLATHATGGVSPVVYRFDLNDPKVYLLARRFPVQDKDVIFVSEALGVPIYRFLHALSYVTGPVWEGYLVCNASSC